MSEFGTSPWLVIRWWWLYGCSYVSICVTEVDDGDLWMRGGGSSMWWDYEMWSIMQRHCDPCEAICQNFNMAIIMHMCSWIQKDFEKCMNVRQAALGMATGRGWGVFYNPRPRFMVPAPGPDTRRVRGLLSYPQSKLRSNPVKPRSTLVKPPFSVPGLDSFPRPGPGHISPFSL